LPKGSIRYLHVLISGVSSDGLRRCAMCRRRPAGPMGPCWPCCGSMIDDVVWVIQCPLAVYVLLEKRRSDANWSKRWWSYLRAISMRDSSTELCSEQGGASDEKVGCGLGGQMQGRQRHASASELVGNNVRWSKRAD
jgi:hypothetical protein